MKRTNVNSSNITSIGYDVTQKILEIEFKGGRVYQYIGVPENIYIALMRASSKGAFFYASIRDKYPTNRV